MASNKKVALVTGISGQDGSYLAELLLSKDYEVHGLIRRSSSFNTGRLEHLYHDPHDTGARLFLHYGDLTDGIGISEILKRVNPNEIYNLAAQSHVRVSFDEPVYTANVDALGVVNILEAMRTQCPFARFYQASSSEMYGQVHEIPQKESTPFHPRSPYGCSKVYGYWQTVNYREAYNIHASNGILFNHESVVSSSPVITYDGKYIDISPIEEVVKDGLGIYIDSNLFKYQSGFPKKDLMVWDKGGWTKIKYASCYLHDQLDKKNPRIMNSRASVVHATSSHVGIMSDGSEKTFADMEIGDCVSLVSFSSNEGLSELTLHQAELLGALVGDGSCHIGNSHYKFTNSSTEFRQRIQYLWSITGGKNATYSPSKSGFSDLIVGQLRLSGTPEWLKSIEIYNKYERSQFLHRVKRVPKAVLNASKEIQAAFLDGYYAADGLKAHKYLYKYVNFKTNSATLAQGLLFLINNVTGQTFNITVEESEQWGKRQFYYSCNFHSNSNAGQNILMKEAFYTKVKELHSIGKSQRGIARELGVQCRNTIRKIIKDEYIIKAHHLSKPLNEIKKIIDTPEYDGWFYDLETESGTFHCGVGLGHVHNSPRRGETFVTRKITRAAARIALGLQSKLFLGNLDAKRDWGHAKDFVEAMWLMLQQPVPDDYVVATGETHTVREFLELVFGFYGLSIDRHVEIDAKYFRPSEVDILIGDFTRAKTVLKWKPKFDFKSLVLDMTMADYAIAAKERAAELGVNIASIKTFEDWSNGKV